MLIQMLQEGWLGLVLTVLVAYLLGSLNFAIIVTRVLSKKDIRSVGSGNAGATNVLRSQGKLPAVLTTLGDLAKSFAAVLIGGWLVISLMPTNHIALAQPMMEEWRLVGQYLAGLCCILGHLYPVYFGFRGGKGVLATLGMTLVLDWRVALICLGLFILVVLVSRMVSLGSVCAAALLPVMTFVFRRFVDGRGDETVWFCTGMSVLIAAILIIKHIPNLKRIVQGTESHLSFGGRTHTES